MFARRGRILGAYGTCSLCTPVLYVVTQVVSCIWLVCVITGLCSTVSMVLKWYSLGTWFNPAGVNDLKWSRYDHDITQLNILFKAIRMLCNY